MAWTEVATLACSIDEVSYVNIISRHVAIALWRDGPRKRGDTQMDRRGVGERRMINIMAFLPASHATTKGEKRGIATA